ncbi:MAG: hypothetical protein ABIG96_02910 [Candidatus Micrarchaeota archaeon]
MRIFEFIKKILFSRNNNEDEFKATPTIDESGKKINIDIEDVKVNKEDEKKGPTQCKKCKIYIEGYERKVFCKECKEYYCENHQSHKNNHKEEKSPKPTDKFFGICTLCKTNLNVLNRTSCIRCGRDFCKYHSSIEMHNCKGIRKTEGKREPKPGDRILTRKELVAISKVWQTVAGYAAGHYEVSGLIEYDGTISLIQTGSPESVEPYYDPRWNKSGILFHTHPNEDPTPSDADHRFAAYVEENGGKVKFIVATQLGFTAYGRNEGLKIFYGWHEI